MPGPVLSVPCVLTHLILSSTLYDQCYHPCLTDTNCRQAVGSVFGTRDRFHGRRVFLWRWGYTGGFDIILIGACSLDPSHTHSWQQDSSSFDNPRLQLSWWEAEPRLRCYRWGVAVDAEAVNTPSLRLLTPYCAAWPLTGHKTRRLGTPRYRGPSE